MFLQCHNYSGNALNSFSSFITARFRPFQNRRTRASRIPQATNVNRRAYWYFEHNPERRTILHCLHNHPDTKIFCSLVNENLLDAALTHELSLPGPFTLLVPNDNTLSRIHKDTMESMLSSKENLSRFIRNHIVSEFWLWRDFLGRPINGQARQRPETILSVTGKPITLKYGHNPNTGDDQVLMNSFPIIHSDLRCHNGVVHVLDGLILP